MRLSTSSRCGGQRVTSGPRSTRLPPSLLHGQQTPSASLANPLIQYGRAPHVTAPAWFQFVLLHPCGNTSLFPLSFLPHKHLLSTCCVPSTRLRVTTRTRAWSCPQGSSVWLVNQKNEYVISFSLEFWLLRWLRQENQLIPGVQGQSGQRINSSVINTYSHA